MSMWGDDLEELKEKLRVAVTALEFYADRFTYISNSGKIGIQPIYHSVENGGDCELINGQMCAGAKARKALETVGVGA